MLHVPWFSQFDAEHVERAGPAACFRACRAMARAVGVVVPESTVGRIQVALAERPDGSVDVDPVAVARAREHLVQQLAADRPVVVGLNYKAGSPNRDGITDHFILVVGRSAGAGLERFHAHDPGFRGAGSPPGNAVLRWEGGNLVRTLPFFPRAWMSMLVPAEGSAP